MARVEDSPTFCLLRSPDKPATGARGEGVRSVVNEIEGLPVSPNDERLRRALYRAIYDFDSPLFRHGVGSRQAIHIVLKNGRVTLEGVVDSNADRQLAYTRARRSRRAATP